MLPWKRKRGTQHSTMYHVGSDPPIVNLNWQVWLSALFWIISFLCFYAWLNINVPILWTLIDKKYILAYNPWLIWSKCQPLICKLYPLYCIVPKLTNKVLLYQAFQQMIANQKFQVMKMISLLMRTLIVYPQFSGRKLKEKLSFPTPYPQFSK